MTSVVALRGSPGQPFVAISIVRWIIQVTANLHERVIQPTSFFHVHLCLNCSNCPVSNYMFYDIWSVVYIARMDFATR